MSTFPRKCPSCGQDMQVCLLRCPACQTEVQGKYAIDRFAQLTPEQLSFLEIFLRCRGNLKDLGAVIGISYPTARNRLDDLIRALNFADDSVITAKRVSILKQVKDGSISPQEAAKQLSQLKGG